MEAKYEKIPTSNAMTALNERARIEMQNFRKFSQNTHSETTNNSVGIILLNLWNRYSPELYVKLLEPNLMELRMGCDLAQCRATHSSVLPVTHWLDKQSITDRNVIGDELKELKKKIYGESDLKLKKLISSDLAAWVHELSSTLLDEAERKCFNTERAWFVEKLQNYASRKQGQLDLIYSYNPKTQEKEPYTIYIWQVLWCLLMALHDDACFINPEYTRRDRLVGLYQLLKEYFNSPDDICNTGGRNALTQQLLHQQYRMRPEEPLVYVLTVVASDISTFIIQHYDSKLSHYLNSKETKEQELGFRILCQWIDDSLGKGTKENTAELIAFRDDAAELTQSLKLRFLSLGQDPNQPTIAQPIAEWIEARDDIPVPNPARWTATIKIISQLKQEPSKNAATLALIDKCLTLDDVPKIMGPIRMSNLHQRIDEACAIIPIGDYEGWLVATGKRISHELDSLDKQMDNDAMLIQINHLEDEFELVLMQAQRDDKGTNLTNSFALLNSYTDDSKQFRRVLHDFINRAGFKLSTIQLKQMLSALAHVEQDGVVLNITPAAVNSILWHAVLVSPVNYSEEFCELLQLLLLKLSKKHHSELKQAWIKSSYPDELLGQMKWLLECAKEKQCFILDIPELLFMPCNLDGLQLTAGINEIYFENVNLKQLTTPLQNRGWWFGLPYKWQLTDISEGSAKQYLNILLHCSPAQRLIELERNFEQFKKIESLLLSIVCFVPSNEFINLFFRYLDEFTHKDIEIFIENGGLKQIRKNRVLYVDTMLQWLVHNLHRCDNEKFSRLLQTIAIAEPSTIQELELIGIMNQYVQNIKDKKDANDRETGDAVLYTFGYLNMMIMLKLAQFENEQERFADMSRTEQLQFTSNFFNDLKNKLSHWSYSSCFINLEYESKIRTKYISEFDMVLCSKQRESAQDTLISSKDLETVMCADNILLKKYLEQGASEDKWLELSNRVDHNMTKIYQLSLAATNLVDTFHQVMETYHNRKSDEPIPTHVWLELVAQYKSSLNWDLFQGEITKIASSRLKQPMTELGKIQLIMYALTTSPKFWSEGFYKLLRNHFDDITKGLHELLIEQLGSLEYGCSDCTTLENIHYWLPCSLKNIDITRSGLFYNSANAPLENRRASEIEQYFLDVINWSDLPKKCGFEIKAIVESERLFTKVLKRHTEEERFFILFKYGKWAHKHIIETVSLLCNVDKNILLGDKSFVSLSQDDINNLPQSIKILYYWRLFPEKNLPDAALPLYKNDLNTLISLLESRIERFDDLIKIFRVFKGFSLPFSNYLRVIEQFNFLVGTEEQTSRLFLYTNEVSKSQIENHMLWDLLSRENSSVRQTLALLGYTSRISKNSGYFVSNKTLHQDNINCLVSKSPADFINAIKLMTPSLMRWAVTYYAEAIELLDTIYLQQFNILIQTIAYTSIRATMEVSSVQHIKMHASKSEEFSDTVNYKATKNFESEYREVWHATKDLKTTTQVTTLATKEEEAVETARYKVTMDVESEITTVSHVKPRLVSLLAIYENERGFFRRYCPGVPSKTRTIVALEKLLIKSKDISKDEVLNILVERDRRSSWSRSSGIINSSSYFQKTNAVVPQNLSATDRVIAGLRAAFTE